MRVSGRATVASMEKEKHAMNADVILIDLLVAIFFIRVLFMVSVYLLNQIRGGDK